MDLYSTHLSTLKKIIENENIKSVFEFGCGNHSTLFFAERCEEVVAIEMQNENWFHEMKSKISNNVTLLCQLGPYHAIETLDKMNRKFDLIFVDGHGDSRWHAINIASKYTDIIVAHDTETSSYNWHLVKLNSDWESSTDTSTPVYTTTWKKKKSF